MIEPLIPQKARRRRFPGRKRLDDRAALSGVVFVLKTGLAWEDLPQELDCGSGMTCWRRLREWLAAGVWDRLHLALVKRLDGAGKIDWSRATVASSSVRAVLGAPNGAQSRRPGQSGQQAPRLDRC